MNQKNNKSPPLAEDNAMVEAKGDREYSGDIAIKARTYGQSPCS